MRDFSLFDILQTRLDTIPLQERVAISFSYDAIEEGLSNNIEVIYQQATQRLSRLGYYLEWARTFQDSDLRPSPSIHRDPTTIYASFHALKEIPGQDIVGLNRKFSNWVTAQVAIELCEFLAFYLLGVYETCIIAQYSNTAITPKDIVKGRIAAQDFENMGVRERLKVLRKNYGIHLTHEASVISLSNLRNVFAHFDGRVDKKFCKDNGVMNVFWPVSTYKLKKRGTNKLIGYHKIKKPFHAEVFEEMQITWLNKPYKRAYKPNDVIQLSHRELNELLAFYVFAFNELQVHLVKQVNSYGFNVKDPELYLIKTNITLIGEDVSDSSFSNA